MEWRGNVCRWMVGYVGRGIPYYVKNTCILKKINSTCI